jgi:putative tryptophan/tyrosine transport system substrate-binding protein
MRRRDFIKGVVGLAAVWPCAASAQQPAMPVIGFLRSTSANASADLVAALRRGLADIGYTEGHNLAIEFRWAENQGERLPGLVADLIRDRCAVIIAAGDTEAHAAKAATKSIPIVFATGADPVKVGLVPSLNRPGGNLTGISFYNSADLLSKQLQFLREVVPKGAVIGVLVNQNNPGEAPQGDAQSAARALGQQILIVNASSDRDFDTAFATLAQQRAGALLIAGNAFFTGQRDRLVALAARYALPTICPLREFVAAGCMMSYSGSLTDAYRQVGLYAGRILKGEKPADLPITLPTKFELVINLKIVKALGLTLPDKLLVAADEVIE